MTATILPTAKTTFFDSNGRPLAGGSVYFYIPNTSTFKNTWQDEGKTILNTNPVLLDASGQAIILGDGQYRQVVYDVHSNLIWDRLTDSPALNSEFQNFVTTIESPSGPTMIAFIQSLTGAKQSTVAKKLSERVSVADFLDTDTPTASQVATALQAAINSGARYVYISKAYQINAPMTLAANQVIDFNGGSLTVTVGTSAPNGVLYGNGTANIKIIDPVIDASATTGLPGINFVDCLEGNIFRGKLTKCNVNFQGSNPATPMDYRIENCKVDLSGLTTSTAIYISSTNGVHVIGCTTCNGKEGIGRYNGAVNMIEMGCHHYSHAQDGSIHVKGSKSIVIGNISRNMGQSGFTTQRYTAGTDVQDVVLAGNLSYGHAFDCFDIRGQVDGSAAWGIDMRLVGVGNIGVGSAGCGVYNVLAEGNTWAGNVFAGNQNPGFLANLSPRTTAVCIASFSNASAVAAGTGKAGIAFQDSPNSGMAGGISTNSSGATQSYGVSFTGTSVDGWITGGYFQNNTVAPTYLGASGTSAYVTGAAMQTTGNVWEQGVVANSGAFLESGFGVPTHVRTKGSLFLRTDGASGELYTSNGDGTWHAFA